MQCAGEGAICSPAFVDKANKWRFFPSNHFLIFTLPVWKEQTALDLRRLGGATRNGNTAGKKQRYTLLMLDINRGLCLRLCLLQLSGEGSSFFLFVSSFTLLLYRTSRRICGPSVSWSESETLAKMQPRVKPSSKSIITTKEAPLRFTIFLFGSSLFLKH